MRPFRAVHGHRRGGFSLLEIMITLTVISTLLGSLLLALVSSTKASRIGMSRQDLEGLARRTLDRIARELMSSGTSVLIPDPIAPFGSSALTYQAAAGVAGEVIAWNASTRLERELDDGETNDGTDENGNGLVDEGRVRLTLDVGGVGERSLTLAHHVREYLEGESPNGVDDNGNGLVDEAGLCFERRDETLLIRLSLERLDLDGKSFVRTVATSVRLRN